MKRISKQWAKWLAGMAAAGVALGLSGTAGAVIVLGGITFEDNAFADQVIAATPGIVYERQNTGPTDRVGTSAGDGVLGSDLASSTIGMTGGQSLTLAFTNNSVVNGAGADLAIFELFQTPGFGTITINGITISVSAVVSSLGMIPIPGMSFSNFVNVAWIDLSAFAIAPGAVVADLQLTITGDSSDYAAFGAIGHVSEPAAAVGQVPEPATVALLGFGLAGLVAARRRRR